MKDIECPYCEKYNDWSGDPIEQDEQNEMECEHCGKNFIFTCTYYPSYSSDKADCLNGAEHNWKEIIGFPREYFVNKRRCSMCGKEITLPTKDVGESK